MQAKKLCFNCFGPHLSKDCSSKFSCSLCKQKHRTLLHRKKAVANVSSVTDNSSKDEENDEETMDEKSVNVQTQAPVPQHRLPPVLLATATVYVQGPDGNRILVRALIDQCSQSSLISKFLSNLLKLRERKTNTTLRSYRPSRYGCQVVCPILPVTALRVLIRVQCGCSRCSENFLVQAAKGKP